MSQTPTTSSIVISSDSESEDDNRICAPAATSLISTDDDDEPVEKKAKVRRSKRLRNAANHKTLSAAAESKQNSNGNMNSDSSQPPPAKAAGATSDPPPENTPASDDGGGRTGDECSVCLDPPVHPVKLACDHTFCYLCAKGLVMSNNSACSLCRRPIGNGYLESAEILSRVSQDLNDTPPVEASRETWQWFYEGRSGWWRFEERTNEELEETFLSGQLSMETMIVGNIYVIDFTHMEQFQKAFPTRKRKIKRDMKSSECKGVAGLGKRSWKSQS